MKCEKCNEKEATFYYSSNINGEKTERHLCEDCAREEGFGEALDYRPASMFNDVFGDMFGGFGGFFDDFFAPRRSLFSAFDSFGSPLRAMMAPALPRIRVVIGEPQTEKEHAPLSEAEQKIPDDAGEEVKARREIAALKQQLHEAVEAENFEKAIELRDKLKELEK